MGWVRGNGGKGGVQPDGVRRRSVAVCMQLMFALVVVVVAAGTLVMGSCSRGRRRVVVVVRLGGGRGWRARVRCLRD